MCIFQSKFVHAWKFQYGEISRCIFDNLPVSDAEPLSLDLSETACESRFISVRGCGRDDCAESDSCCSTSSSAREEPSSFSTLYKKHKPHNVNRVLWLSWLWHCVGNVKCDTSDKPSSWDAWCWIFAPAFARPYTQCTALTCVSSACFCFSQWL